MALDLPYGVRFHPTESETMDLLLFKLAGVPLLSFDYIGAADLYGNREPWEIFGGSDSSEKLYFFSKAKKIAAKNPSKWPENARRSRDVGKGKWLQKSNPIPIRGKISGKISGVEGCKRRFRYVSKQEGGGGDLNGTWLMAEYSFSDDQPVKEGDTKWRVKEEFKDWVICVLKKKP